MHIVLLGIFDGINCKAPACAGEQIFALSKSIQEMDDGYSANTHY